MELSIHSIETDPLEFHYFKQGNLHFVRLKEMTQNANFGRFITITNSEIFKLISNISNIFVQRNGVIA